jgi:hypothetical protein
VDAWLTKARDALVAETGSDPDDLDLTDEETREVLDLARIAAHTSGDRRNAPLLCYLVGRARRNRDVASLAEAVRRSTS